MPPDPHPFADLEDAEGVDAWEAMKLSAPPRSAEEMAIIEALVARIHTSLAPGDPRRHHFIPEFFQKRFATGDDQLAVLRLGVDGHRLVHVSRIAVMNDLYTTIDTEVGQTVAVERLLAEVDGLAAAAIERLTGDGFPPSPDDRFSLAMWVALLKVRDPYTRRTMEALADSAYKLDLSLASDPDAARSRLHENLGRKPTDDEVNELVEAANDLDSFEVVPHQNELVKQMLDSALAMVPHLLSRRYALVRFPESGLVLSDRPLVLYRHPNNRQPFMGIGIINADELWLPLDRRTACILHSDDGVGEMAIDAPADHGVDDFNQAVVLNAVDEVYCHPDDLARVTELRFPKPDTPLMEMTGGDWADVRTDGINLPPERKRHRRYRRADAVGGSESDTEGQ